MLAPIAAILVPFVLSLGIWHSLQPYIWPGQPIEIFVAPRVPPLLVSTWKTVVVDLIHSVLCLYFRCCCLLLGVCSYLLLYQKYHYEKC
jgi:hypothetical protein